MRNGRSLYCGSIQWVLGVLALGFLATPQIQAAGTTSADFLKLVVHAAPAAMSAGTAINGGSELLAWNPAGILGATYPEIAFTHFSSFADTAYEQLEGVLPDWLDGTWAGRLFYASTYNFMEIDEFGNEVGTLKNHDVLLHVAYARPLLSELQVGAAVKLFNSQLSSYSSSGAALDLGARYTIHDTPFALGVALQNLGVMGAYESDRAVLPSLLFAGAAARWSVLQKQWLEAALDLQQPLAGDDTLGVSLGMQYSLGDLLFVRGGYRAQNETGTLSLGAGLQLGEFGLDYAFQTYGVLGDNHRFTLSYAFLPKQLKTAEPRELTEQEAQAAKLAALAKPMAPTNVKSLTAMPRDYESRLAYVTPKLEKPPREWHFEIRDSSGKLIKTLSGAGLPPKELSWDGRDQQGQLIPREDKYNYVFKTETLVVAQKDVPKLLPVFKLQFEDGDGAEPEARFIFEKRTEVKAWNLFIRRSGGKEPIQVLKGEGAIPEHLIWDGLDKDHKLADTRKTYAYSLGVTYADQSEIIVSEDIKPVPARRVFFPDHKELSGVLILGILFDFNSAVLRPEMLDKLSATELILKKYAGQASATCEGHSDEIGEENYNRKLSEQRAQMVAKYLMERPNMPAGVISIVGFGKAKPENLLNSDKGRERNRRVEVRLALPVQASPAP